MMAAPKSKKAKLYRKEVLALIKQIEGTTDLITKKQLINRGYDLLAKQQRKNINKKDKGRKAWALDGAENLSHPIFYSGGPRW